MKRFFSFLLSMLILLPAAGCKSKNSFSVTFENQCDVEIQSAFVEYYVGDTDEIGKILVASSSATEGMTGNPFPKGEMLTFQFEKDMFSEDTDLRAFSFELYLVLADGTEVRAGNIGIAVSFGEEYRYVLRGDTADGFLFQRQG